MNFDQLLHESIYISRITALDEVQRENAKRRDVFPRWSRQKPSKASTYAAQYRATAALETILTVLTDREWHDLLKRHQRHLKEQKAQQSLF